MPKKPDLRESLGALFDAMLDSRRAEVEGKHGPMLDALRGSLPLNDAEGFGLELDQLIFTLEDLVSEAHPEIPKANAHRISFLYLHYNFMEKAISFLAESKEGPACCVDKARWLLKSYEKHLADGSLPDMTIEEKTFWKPHFGTAEQWVEFIQSLEHLYYGKPTRYLKSVALLLFGKEIPE